MVATAPAVPEALAATEVPEVAAEAAMGCAAVGITDRLVYRAKKAKVAQMGKTGHQGTAFPDEKTGNLMGRRSNTNVTAKQVELLIWAGDLLVSDANSGVIEIGDKKWKLTRPKIRLY